MSTNQKDNRIKIWLEAFRLRTLPLALASIGMGSFLAANDQKFNWGVFVLSSLTTILLQILSNLANDYGDSIHGADSADREGPKRAVQTGAISSGAMKNGMYIFGVLAFISGISLLYISLSSWKMFFVFLGLGILSIIAAVTYTAGKKPYGYAGLGDLSVFLFFGWLGVAGTYFLHAGGINPWVLLPATSCSCFAVAVLNINNIRDIDSDLKAGKHSIPVRIGRKWAVRYHWFLLGLGLLVALVYSMYHYESPFNYLFLLSLPLIFLNARGVYVNEKPAGIDPFLKQMAITALLFVVLFGIGRLI